MVEGKVETIEANTIYSSARNIRVFLEDVTTYCSLQTNNDSAYINSFDAPDNFNVFVSLLISAKMSDATVKMFIHEGPEGCLIHRVDF